MSVKRTFIPGDQWLYYKMYCGARTADMVLTEMIKPLTEKLLGEQMIGRWFFIRYNDPEFHLRIRFYLKESEQAGKLICNVRKAVAPYVEADSVYKIQIDTYQREIERYGSKTIDLSETLFYHESSMLLAAIDLITDEKLYFFFVLKAIDRLLNDLEYTIEEKRQLVSVNCSAFKKEFQAGSPLKKQLNKKYGGLKDELSAFLNPSGTAMSEYAPLEALLNTKTNNTTAIIKRILAYKKEDRLEVAWDSLTSSYIHMLVNRAFRSRQRFYELVCYDFLNQYYRRML